ncbi:MAG: SDR family NAD(P)-dependent oxidoreductase [Bacteroidetes bacterium]|nr:SDR family NAD(P)-dependent oxidoreductase [Bacteroidota bacterium]
MELSKSEKSKLKSAYGPWAVVTGATSGIGLGLAEHLAASGIHLVLNARNKERLEQTSQLLNDKYSIKTITVAADMSLEIGVGSLIAASRDLDIGLLVPCAGFGTSGLFEKSDLATEVNMLRVNCEAVLRLAHHFIPLFKKRQRSGIILISSLVAFQGVPFAGHYAATKAYIQSLAEALTPELKHYGIDVLVAAPGPVESGFGERSNLKMAISMKASDVSLPILKALGRKSTVLPGWLSIVLVNALRTVPRWAKVLIMEKVMGGMTAHQRA